VTEPTIESDSLVGDLVAILFVAGEGADRRAVQRALGLTNSQLARLVTAARDQQIPGLLIQERGDTLRLITHPDSAPAVRRFVQAPGALRLSAAALETLAVIAYSQPTTRSQIHEARGVDSDGPIATLMQHGLIAEAGRAETPGRPVLFETTAECLTLLGLASIEDLPPLRPSPEPLPAPD
jgi:segregation and condensation protein B